MAKELNAQHLAGRLGRRPDLAGGRARRRRAHPRPRGRGQRPGHAAARTAGSRAALGLYAPQPPALATLSRAVKAAFDPLSLFNPGRSDDEKQFHPRADGRSAARPAAKAVRACVHCGICTATCPTYVLLGDERDSPRGRIVLMKDMLEKGGAPTKEQVYHIDRCLSCLNCKTACPSSVNYQRLVDQARAHIQEHYRRPLATGCCAGPSPR